MASENLTQMLARNPLLGSALARGDGLRALDVSGSGIGKDAVITLTQLLAALRTYNAGTNSSGNSTITPGACAIDHLEVTTVAGSGSETRVFILATTNAPLVGTRITHRVALPVTAEITLEWRNATSGGTLLTSAITDGSGDDLVAEFYGDGTAWNFLRFQSPANS